MTSRREDPHSPPPAHPEDTDPSAISGEEHTLRSDAPGVARPGVKSPSLSGTYEPKLVTAEVVAGRYEIIRYIARGGMGEVYEAEDLELKERIALKVIRGETDDPTAEDRFKREILLSRKVTHPNVCRIFDVGYHHRDDGERVVFLTMELLSGETLWERIRRDGPMNVDEAAGVARQIASGLSAAHAAEIVHRDLKSGNVLLVPKPTGGVRAVVTDFGLAHVLGGADAGRSLSGSGGIVGTPGYMAPEQVEGGRLTARTDIYAFGIVMFEMVTGRLPFEGVTPLSIATKRLTTEAPSPRSLRRELPRRWERAILACLDRDPDVRPPTARAVVELLDEEIDRTSLKLDKLHRRAPIVRPLSAFIVLLVAALVAWRTWRKPQKLGDELRARGATLGAFESTDPAKAMGYGRQLRNAMRTELMFDMPIVGTRLEFTVPGMSSPMYIGTDRPPVKSREPMRIDGQYTITGEGANRVVEATIRVIDPKTNEQRTAIVERGPLRSIDDVVIHLGERLRATAGLTPTPRKRLSAAGAVAFERAREAHRNYELATSLELLENLLPTEPGSSEVRFMVARVLATLELDTASSVAVHKTLDLGEPDDPFWKARVQALATRRDPSRSTGLLEDMHRRFPDDLDVSLDLATVLTHAQRAADADRLLVGVASTAHSERDALRIELTRLIIAERRSRWDEIRERYPALLDRARKLGSPGLELWASRMACEFYGNKEGRDGADRMCASLSTLATAQRVPGAIALSLTSRIEARLAFDSDAVAVALTEQAAILATELGGRRRLADALNDVALLRAEHEPLDRLRPQFEEALAVARDAHDHRAVITMLTNLAYYEALAGHLEAEARYLRESLELARDTSSQELIAFILCRLARSDGKIGDMKNASELAREGRRLAATTRDANSTRECRLVDAVALQVQGDFTGAAKIFQTMADTDAAIEQHEMAFDSRQSICDTELRSGASRAALSCIDKLLVAGTPGSTAEAEAPLLTMRALALAQLGRLDEAAAIEKRVRDKITALSPVFGGSWYAIELAQTERLLGRPAAAILPVLDRVTSSAVTAQHRSLEGYARLEHVELLRRDHLPEAADEARSLAEFASHHGYTWLEKQAQRLAGGTSGTAGETMQK